jgi:predicted transcriptional regulator
MITREQFLQTIAGLGYSVSTANRILGIARSTVYRINRGTSEVPEVVARLLDMYIRYGIPEEHRQ